MARPRVDVDGDALADALQPKVRGLGRCWLSCSDAPRCQDAKYKSSEITTESHLAILGVLHQLAPDMNFKRSDIDAACRSLYHRNRDSPDWACHPKHEQEYLKTMGNRLANLTYFVRQALSKSTPPSWTHRLPWIDAPPGP